MPKHDLGVRHAWFLLSLLIWTGGPVVAGQSDGPASAESRLKATVGYLVSDELEGRSVGSKGIELAAAYLASQFAGLQLRTDLFDGTPYQKFTVNASPEMQGPRLDRDAIPGKNSDSDPKPEPAQHVPPGDARAHGLGTRNVVGILEGEGPLSNETIVIGAHYDHLGKRPAKAGADTIYNGANDNASGVATMLEVARILSARRQRLPRRVVFVAFSAEERGLVGSFYYVRHPPVPLETTIAMFSLDMLGRPSGDVLGTAGTRSSPMLAGMLERAASRSRVALLALPGGLTGSDHLPFYACRIPAVHFMTTGGFGDYHRPSDESDKLDYAWMSRVARLTAELVVAVAETRARPKFVEDQLSDTLVRGLIQLWAHFSDTEGGPASPPSAAAIPVK